jgi:methylmalonyl-CoA mutase
VGVNTFLSSDGSPFVIPEEVIRSDSAAKDQLVADVRAVRESRAKSSDAAVSNVQEAALAGENVFSALMEASKVCSLGTMTRALHAVGGQYRRNM